MLDQYTVICKNGRRLPYGWSKELACDMAKIIGGKVEWRRYRFDFEEELDYNGNVVKEN